MARSEILPLRQVRYPVLGEVRDPGLRAGQIPYALWPGVRSCLPWGQIRYCILHIGNVQVKDLTAKHCLTSKTLPSGQARDRTILLFSIDIYLFYLFSLKPPVLGKTVM